MFKRSRIDYILLFCTIAAVAAGIVTLYYQEVVIETAGEGRWLKQLIFFGIALLFCLFLMRLNYQYIGDYALPLYILAMVALLITLVPFIGSAIKGARSWIRFAGLGIQTSEPAKLATIILLAKFLELRERDMDRIPTLVLGFLIAIVPMLLIIIQPDFGSAFIFAPILMTMFFVGGADLFHISSVVTFFGVSLSIPLYIEYHRITLVEPLLQRLNDLGKLDIMPAVRILKNDIWTYAEGRLIPGHITSPQDLSYLNNLMGNRGLFAALQEAVADTRRADGGFLLRLLENEILLLVIGGVFAVASLALVIIRFTQGPSYIRLRKYYIPLGIWGISLLSAMAVHSTFSFRYYQVVRVTAFINPAKFSRDEAYHIRASKAAIGSGRIFGRGFSRGDMTMGERPLVPESSTDFIFTSWAERTGFIGSILAVLLLLAIPLRGLMISFEARDKFGTLMAAGISSMLFYHIFFNAGIALGLMPVTGLPLSFMSYGGSHLFTCMISVGILLSIHRRRFAN